MAGKSSNQPKFSIIGRRGADESLFRRYLGELSSERIHNLHLNLIGANLFADPLPDYRYDSSPLSVKDALSASWGRIHVVFGEAMVRFDPLRELTDHGGEEDPEEDIHGEEGHYQAVKEAGQAEAG